MGNTENIVCPYCQKSDRINIQKNKDPIRYICNYKHEPLYVEERKSSNRKMIKRTFTIDKLNLKIERLNLQQLLQKYFNHRSIKEYKKIYKKYRQMRLSGKIPTIEDDDIIYLEDYLVLDIPRKLIAKLFCILPKTLRNLIKKEEHLETNGESRFKRDEPLTEQKLTILDTKIDHENLFNSAIECAFTNFTDEDYKEIDNQLTYIKINKRNKLLSPHTD